MSRPQGNFTSAVRYYFARWFDPSANNVQYNLDNDKSIAFADPTDTFSIDAIKADADSRVQVDRQAMLGDRESAPFYFNAAGGLVTQCFFINSATHNVVITGIEELHATAETAAGTATLVVTHDTSGQAPGAGTVVMTNTFNLKATANTVQSATLLGVTWNGKANNSLILAPGDRLSIKVGGTATITALAGVTLNLVFAPGFKELIYTYAMNAHASIATQSFGIANRDLVATSCWMTWSTAGTDSGTVTLAVTADSSTTAPGAGTSILAAAQSVKLTANTPVQVPLSATAANLLLRAGTRVSVLTAGTLTALAGVVVSVAFGPVGALAYVGENQATFTLNANASLATQGFFIADRDYEVLDFSAVWSTAGTDSGAVTIDCTIDKGAVAPGAGTSCLAGTVNVKTTANTTSFPGVTTTRHNRLLSQGDLLSLKFTGTLTALAGVTATVTLAPK
jgi:hypothetical protein